MLVGSAEARAKKSGNAAAMRGVALGRFADHMERVGSADQKAGKGWTLIGLHFTGCSDVEYPYDIGIVRAIRRINPSLVPVFRKKIFKSPTGAEYVFPHHGLACYDPDTDESIESFKTMPMPDNCEWPRPTAMIRWFEADYKPGSTFEKMRLPRPFVPYGPWVLQWVEEADQLNKKSAKEKEEWLDTHGEAAKARKTREHEESEAAYRGKTELKYQRELMGKFGEDDWKELKARMRGEIEPESKPFVGAGGIGSEGTNPPVIVGPTPTERSVEP